jgi:hypothetical protein
VAKSFRMPTHARTRKGGESISTGKILVTCTVTIIGLWSHSGTGEEFADDPNALTAADAQAFKRSCACFGLGRYLYAFEGAWVDLDHNQRPKRILVLPAWAIPENWLKGMRPPGTNGERCASHRLRQRLLWAKTERDQRRGKQQSFCR